TQKDVAALLGISRSYVSRIETKALKALRKRFETSSNL
ncbi:MAG: sigma factor-like helix-turn-helix DNA-binding protein, partial [Ruminococcus sp.]|nr:sigma factor-like helix-turn-helix DNA-binding protein [Ruminococcus sp.]